MKLPLSTVAAAVFVLGSAPVVQAESTHNEEIRAAMVLNFARFADWPPSRFANTSAVVVVCVESGTALGDELAALEGKEVGNRSLHIRQTSVARYDSGCQVGVFGHRATPKERVEELNEAGVLTIGEAAGFSKAGAIEFVQVGRQLRFRINNTVASAGGIKLRSQLLRLALGVE